MTRMPGFAPVLKKAAELVAQHGPVPVVAVVIGGIALIALAVGAPPLPTTIVAIAAFAVTVYSSERKAHWTRDQRRAEFDDDAKLRAPDIQLRIKRRIQKRKTSESPDLFDPEDRQK